MYFNFECTHIFQTGKQRNKPKKKKKKNGRKKNKIKQKQIQKNRKYVCKKRNNYNV